MGKEHIAFLEQNLHSPVEVNIKRYFNSAKPCNGVDIERVPGFLNGINKNDSQQFDIDFDLGEAGFEYKNCFDETCRSWSHTAHAECITVLKRSISQLTDEEVMTCVKLMNFSDSDNRDNIPQWRESLLLGVKLGALWQNCTDYLRSIGILIPYMGHSVEEILTRGWAKIKTT